MTLSNPIIISPPICGSWELYGSKISTIFYSPLFQDNVSRHKSGQHV